MNKQWRNQCYLCRGEGGSGIRSDFTFGNIGEKQPFKQLKAFLEIVVI